MQTTIDQISDRIYRISTCIPQIAPGGFTFNQFLLDADEPLLYHTGMRALFPPSARRSRRSCRCPGCAGSRSLTWKPTGAAR